MLDPGPSTLLPKGPFVSAEGAARFRVVRANGQGVECGGSVTPLLAHSFVPNVAFEGQTEKLTSI